MSNNIPNMASTEAVINTYMYLANKLEDDNIKSGTCFSDIVDLLNSKSESGTWSSSELQQLTILKNAVQLNDALANTNRGRFLD